MALDLSTLSDFAWSDIAKAAKQAMVSAALGGNTMTINGRVVGRITIEEAKSLYQYATEQANVEANGENGSIALVCYGDAS
jgi:hypothetical protein